MGMKEEIAEMIDMKEDEVVIVTQAPSTDPPKDGDKKDEGAATTPPATKPPTTKAPATSPPATKPPKDEDEDEIVKLRAENLNLKTENEGLKKIKEKATPKTSPPHTEPPIEEADFLGDVEDVEDLINDKKKLNTLLNTVYKRGVETAAKRHGKPPEISPEMLRSSVESVIEIQKATNEFYTKNKDLEPFKKVVSTVFGELTQQHSDWKPEKLLDETGTETRRRLGLKPSASAQPNKGDKSKVKPPVLPPGSKGSRQSRQKPEPSQMQKEIDEMNAI